MREIQNRRRLADWSDDTIDQPTILSTFQSQMSNTLRTSNEGLETVVSRMSSGRGAARSVDEAAVHHNLTETSVQFNNVSDQTSLLLGNNQQEPKVHYGGK